MTQAVRAQDRCPRPRFRVPRRARCVGQGRRAGLRSARHPFWELRGYGCGSGQAPVEGQQPCAEHPSTRDGEPVTQRGVLPQLPRSLAASASPRCDRRNTSTTTDASTTNSRTDMRRRRPDDLLRPRWRCPGLRSAVEGLRAPRRATAPGSGERCGGAGPRSRRHAGSSRQLQRAGPVADPWPRPDPRGACAPPGPVRHHSLRHSQALRRHLRPPSQPSPVREHSFRQQQPTLLLVGKEGSDAASRSRQQRPWVPPVEPAALAARFPTATRVRSARPVVDSRSDAPSARGGPVDGGC